jgi:hypothetical protein
MKLPWRASTLVRADTLDLMRKLKELLLNAQSIARRQRHLCATAKARQQASGR